MSTDSLLPPSVNFHLWQPCNMKCQFCFATFLDVKQEILPKGHMPRDEAIEVTKQLASTFDKITFVGGEPTLCPWLHDLIEIAHQAGCTTMIVTNGSRLSNEYIEMFKGILDWVTISVDSASHTTNRQLGRRVGKEVASSDNYHSLARRVHEAGIRLKVNTVVSQANAHEDMSELIAVMKPERWKIFQVLPVEGQNNGSVDSLLINEEMFQAYIDRHRQLIPTGTTIVPENNQAMTGSYAMVDPAGRFFDNMKGHHRYSAPILEVGVETAWKSVLFSEKTFYERGGLYKW